MGKIPYIGRRMTVAQLKNHLKSLKFEEFNPSLITVHHTGKPNLTQRPDGFTNQHLLNLKHYYEVTMDWDGAPHFFVDDIGIIVFQALNKRGVHAVSFNKKSWGIEMLGNYDTAVDYANERRKVIFENTYNLIAALCDFKNIDPDTLKFHRDDPKTTKTCPGKYVSKTQFIEEVKQKLENHLENWAQPVFKIVHNGKETIWIKTRVQNNRALIPIREFLNKIEPGHFGLVKIGNNVHWTTGLKFYSTKVADIDENGAAWAYLRDTCDIIGAEFTKM